MHFPEDLPPHLLEKLHAMQIRPEDIEEHFIHGHGHGGQKINKTASCVQLHHIPSGITVRSQESREQHHNRIAALELLFQKLEEHQQLLKAAEAHEQFLERKQHENRPHHVHEQRLEEKRHRSDIKDARNDRDAVP